MLDQVVPDVGSVAVYNFRTINFTECSIHIELPNLSINFTGNQVFLAPREPLIRTGRIKLRVKMIKIKAGSARNSPAIAKFTLIFLGNAEVAYFRLKLIVHVLISGSLTILLTNGKAIEPDSDDQLGHTDSPDRSQKSLCPRLSRVQFTDGCFPYF
jgi:hypothetical protein